LRGPSAAAELLVTDPVSAGLIALRMGFFYKKDLGKILTDKQVDLIKKTNYEIHVRLLPNA